MEKLRKILLNTITLLGSMVAGAVCGKLCPVTLDIISPVNSAYTALMQVCALPILICAIVCGLAKIFRPEFRHIIYHFIVAMVVSVLLTAAISTLAGVIGGSYMVSTGDQRVEFGKISFSQSEDVSISDSFKEVNFYATDRIEKNSFTAQEFVELTIAKNIFKALGEEAYLQIVIFFILFGVAACYTDSQYGGRLQRAFESFQQTLCKISYYVLMLLPFSLFYTVGSIMDDIGVSRIIRVSIGYICVMNVTLLIVFAAFFGMLTLKIRINPIKHLLGIKDTFFVSIGAVDKTIILPVAMDDSVKGLGIQKETIDITTSICNTIFASGRVVFAAVTFAFALRIYEIPITPQRILFIFAASALYGILGSSFRVAFSFILFYSFLQPIGIPSDLISVVLAGTSIFYMGMVYFVSVYSNIVVAAYIAPEDGNSGK